MRLCQLLPLLAVLLTTAPATVCAAGVELVRVWPHWQEAENFDRIGEYFGREESTSGQILLRTDARERGGYYFLIRVRSPQANADARFEVSVIRPDSPDPKKFTFPAQLPVKECVFHLGLTGSAWPGGKKAAPAAWKIALVDGSGRVLAEQKSFLWERPEQSP